MFKRVKNIISHKWKILKRHFKDPKETRDFFEYEDMDRWEIYERELERLECIYAMYKWGCEDGLDV